jgi:hypothetical protein
MENRKLVVNSEKIMEDLLNMTPEQKESLKKTSEALKRVHEDIGVPLTEEERKRFAERLREATQRRNERRKTAIEEEKKNETGAVYDLGDVDTNEVIKQTQEERELFEQIMNGTAPKQEININIKDYSNIGEDR